MRDTLNQSLRQYTTARVELGRTGVSLRTKEVLDFHLAHAQARDAVYAALDVAGLLHNLKQRGLLSRLVKSAAADRYVYLRRPDLGRTLSPESAAEISVAPCDIAFVIADGLSALAIDRHALSLLDAVLPLLDSNSWKIGAMHVVEQGRVAIGDEIGERLQAAIAVVLIGERPGLSSPDSLGVYVTWAPRRGRTDAERNCISNIRPEGLGYAEGARVLHGCLAEARNRKLTGVSLTSAIAARPGRLHGF
jgi:ethanolamine ammonia-lyase small subunit